MDDLQRTLLMEAISTFGGDDQSALRVPYGLCGALARAMENILGYYPEYPELRTFFPQVFQAFPEKYWFAFTVDIHEPPSMTYTPDLLYRWSPYWPAPRIALLRQLLSDHHNA